MKKIGILLLLALIAVFPMFANGAEETADAASPSENEEVVLHVVDWSDSSKALRDEFNRIFEERHPGVKVLYDCLTVDQFKNTIITSIKSGDAPDLFPIPVGTTLSMALNEGWYQPVDQYLGEDFFSSFTPEAWQEGITVMDGHVYTIPEAQPNISSVIFYNKDLVAAAGYPEPPKTYSEFLDCCQKVTEMNEGKAWGWIEGGKQLNRLNELIVAFSAKAGAKLPQASFAITNDGIADYNNPQTVAALDVFKKIADNGWMHPNTLNMGAPEARELFAQGEAAFLAQGMWCIPIWTKDYPDLNIGVMDVPVPDGQDPYLYGVPQATWNPWMGIYKQSKHPELAAEYLRCLYAEDYEYKVNQTKAGNSICVIPEINEKYIINPVQKEYYEVANRNTRIIPVATIRDTAFNAFYTKVRTISPALSNIFQGVISGGIEDPVPYLQTLEDATTAEWKRACEDAGLDFDLLIFPNWDMTRDYTAEDYAALK